jgi:hypothetical protein
MPRPELVVSQLAEGDYADWNAFVAGAPTGSLYARTEYLDALCGATGSRFRVLAVRQGDQLLGGVGLYEETTPFGVIVSPRLLLYYNGPVLRQADSKYPSEQTARALKTLTALESELRGGRYGIVKLRGRPPLVDARPFLAQGWRGNPGYTYVVSITDLEQTRGRIEQNLRRLIDRCDRTGFTFTVDDDFDSFFRLHSSTMDRVDFRVYLTAPVFRRFYETLSQQGLAQIFHARLSDGQSAAAQLVLLGHPVTHTVAAGADPAHMKSGVTAFLRWKVFEHLFAAGHQANDLTDASLNPVTHFKSQLGGNLEPHLELWSPESSRFRWGQRAAALERSAKGTARAIVRRIKGPRKSE